MPVICILLVAYGMAKAQGDSFQHRLGNGDARNKYVMLIFSQCQ